MYKRQILVKHDTNRQADILLSYPTKEAGDIAYEFDVLYKRGYVVTTPSCSGLEPVSYTHLDVYKRQELRFY